MYGYRTKHKLLGIMVGLCFNKRDVQGNYVADTKIFETFTHKEYDLVGRSLTNLSVGGYLKKDGNSFFITDKGYDALADNYFLKEDIRLKSTLVRDGVTLICTVVVAYATVYALRKDANVTVNERFYTSDTLTKPIEIKLQMPQNQNKLDTLIYLQNKH